MKSGKSLELIAQATPHEFTQRQVLYVQPKANVRDSGISSRLGVNAKALSVASLSEIALPFDVIGIDEVNMFPPEDASIVETWLKQDKAVFISGLDLDYRGKMPPIMHRLFQLKPDEIICKIAVCDVCKKYRAQFSQILHNHKPVLSGLPLVTPEDGTYEYQARCRDCFVKK